MLFFFRSFLHWKEENISSLSLAKQRWYNVIQHNSRRGRYVTTHRLQSLHLQFSFRYFLKQIPFLRGSFSPPYTNLPFTVLLRSFERTVFRWKSRATRPRFTPFHWLLFKLPVARRDFPSPRAINSRFYVPVKASVGPLHWLDHREEQEDDGKRILSDGTSTHAMKQRDIFFYCARLNFNDSFRFSGVVEILPFGIETSDDSKRFWWQRQKWKIEDIHEIGESRVKQSAWFSFVTKNSQKAKSLNWTLYDKKMTKLFGKNSLTHGGK